jgi:hypothetical protein
MQDLNHAMIKEGSFLLLIYSRMGYKFSVLNRPPEIWLPLLMVKLMKIGGKYKNNCMKHTASVLTKTLS